MRSSDNTNGICCPKCGSVKSYVVDSRAAFNMVRRRRVCGDCEQRYSTYEIILNVHKPSELAKKMKEHHLEILKNMDSMLDLIAEVSKLSEREDKTEQPRPEGANT